MDREFDVLQNYKAIGNKLKKRLLKKPNYSEASDQYSTLTKVLKHQDCPQYAGFCCIAKAHCENALNNPVGETDALVEAARLFFNAEKQNVDVKCPALEEHLVEAIHCYNQAIKIYKREGHHALAAMLSLEIAGKLIQLEKPQEASEHFLRAAEIQKHYNVIDYLQSCRQAATCKCITGEYNSALKILTDISVVIEAYEKKEPFVLVMLKDLICACEIDRVFLLLLMQSSPQQLSTANGKVMEKYVWENMENARPSWLSENLFLLLQSVIMAFQAEDVESLKDMEASLCKHMKSWQYQIFFELIKCLSKIN
eukprot:gene18904-20807_t